MIMLKDNLAYIIAWIAIWSVFWFVMGKMSKDTKLSVIIGLLLAITILLVRLIAKLG